MSDDQDFRKLIDVTRGTRPLVDEFLRRIHVDLNQAYIKNGQFYVKGRDGNIRILSEHRRYRSIILLEELANAFDEIAQGNNIPPAPAERFLSYLLPPDRLREAIGDFEE